MNKSAPLTQFFGQRVVRDTTGRAGGPSRVGRSVAGLMLAAAFIVAPVGASRAADAYVPAPAEAGTAIPEATVRLGLRPYADGSFPIIGVKKGFFSDVGIKISPPDGLGVTEDTTNSLLVRGDIDVVHGYPPNSLPTYQTSDAIKQIMFHDVIVAGCILANPKLDLKGIKEYMAEGMDFDKAIAAAVAPLQGKSLASPPVANERLFEETISKLSGVTWQHQIMDDSKVLVAAKANQIDFAHPGGAPIVYSLLQDKWKQLVCLDDLIAHGPLGDDSPVLASIVVVGLVANGDWVNKNANTTLRYISAVWRTIAAITADPSLYDIQAPYLNGFAGTSLTGTDIANTVKLFQPYVPFEDNAKFYTEPDSLLNYQRLYKKIIGALQQNGVVPEGLTPDKFAWGGKLYEQLVDYKDQTDKLLAGLDESKLTDDKKAFVTEAKKYYAWYDFLDAYRFAKAAAE